MDLISAYILLILVLIKIDPLSIYIQQVNIVVWRPGQELAVDEIIVRFEGRAKKTTIVPNKPTPTGFKV
jgi:hypothetical protein